MIPNTTAGSPVKPEQRIELIPSTRLTLASSLIATGPRAADVLSSRRAGLLRGVLAGTGAGTGCPKSAAASPRLPAKSSSSATTFGTLISAPQPALWQRTRFPAALSGTRYFCLQPGHRTSIGIERLREFGHSGAPKRTP